MQNNDPKTKEDVRDPQGKIGWPTEKGRDGERTPMQWTADANGGFSKVTPWLPVPPSAMTHNVATELADPCSILNFYKRLLSLRRQEKALTDGDYTPLDESNQNVLSFLRQFHSDAVLVVLNMSATPQKVLLNLAPKGLANAKRSVLLTTGTAATRSRGAEISVEPFTVYIEKLMD